jgi:chromosome segregation ATPase
VLHSGIAAGTPAANKDSGATKLTAALARSYRSLDTLRMQLRSQSADIDELDAENTELRSTIKTLRGEIVRLRTNQQADAHALLHLAGRLLAFSQATGVDLDNATKDIFRRRGWTTIARQTEARR